MLISLNWIRDFVDLPADLDPNDLAERFTVTTAEVESVRQIRVSPKGLIAARVISAKPIPQSNKLSLINLDTGAAGMVETVTSAANLREGLSVVYAPPGSSLSTMPDIKETTVAGVRSVGMILAGEAVGVPLAALEPILLGPEFEPGQCLPTDIFDDWIIEVDNKSITHRPDLWGHYGIAREMAAMYGCPLKPYDVVPAAELAKSTLPTIDIKITDPLVCRRYCGLVVENVPHRPAALWMQLRLGHVGLRPIDGLVDLTNYIMTDLGQPMHAFDGDKVSCIEVAKAKPNETFRTLDGDERVLLESDLMIQCKGQSIALAGVMGGLDCEVSESTKSLLLESANFAPATIRLTATRLGLRTDASARFEKSLDPAHASLAIGRFMFLARDIYPDMTVASQLSDAYPNPMAKRRVTVNPKHVSRIIGQDISIDDAAKILRPLEFSIEADQDQWQVSVPSFRAGNDVSIEVDVIEELARYIGYDSIEPAMPCVTMRRFEVSALHDLENKTLRYLTGTHRFNEIQGYNWYDQAWLTQLGIESGPCIELRNPAAQGLEKMRRSLMPSLLASLARNRFHFDDLSIIEMGSVFEPASPNDHEFRHFGLIRAQRSKKAEKMLFEQLKGSLADWCHYTLTRSVEFAATVDNDLTAWEDRHRTAKIIVDGQTVGSAGVLPLTMRRSMDEHLQAWSVAWAEICLSGLESLPAMTETLGRIPRFPLADADFTFMVPATIHYTQVLDNLRSFEHPLLKEFRFMGSYEGKSIPQDKRALTVRLVIGCDDRTLVDEDMNTFRSSFEKLIQQLGFERR